MSARPAKSVQRYVYILYWHLARRWRRGVVVECRTCDQEVVGSSLSQAPWRKNSGQVSHTYVPLSPSSTSWYWPKGGDV